MRGKSYMSAFPCLVVTTFLAVLIRKHSLFLFHPIFRKELLELYYAALTQLTPNVKSINGIYLSISKSSSVETNENKYTTEIFPTNEYSYYMMQNTKMGYCDQFMWSLGDDESDLCSHRICITPQLMRDSKFYEFPSFSILWSSSSSASLACLLFIRTLPQKVNYTFSKEDHSDFSISKKSVLTIWGKWLQRRELQI